MVFNLIDENWLPVVGRGGGERRCIRPAEIADPELTDVEFAWGRPDLNVATYELLIGLLSVAFPPKDDDHWRDLLEKPPAVAELVEALKPLQLWFNLDGDGPRFMQDFDGIEADELPCDALLIESPGANTLKQGGDLFVKSDRMPNLSPAAAAIALYALQSFAPSGGAGHRTSLRGGGPLTTLIRGQRDASVWQRVWLNVAPLPDQIEPLPADLSERLSAARIFPWCAPTKTSEGGTSLKAGEGHPLQAAFSMPRRIRLSFKHAADVSCAVTGPHSDINVTGFAMKSYGVNYDESWNARGWRHTLTPYYQPKAGKGTELPVHPKSSRLGYKQWASLIYGQEGRNDDTGAGRGIARNLEWFRMKRRRCVAENILAAGWVMDNMKALDYLEAEFPLILAPNEDVQQELESLAHRLVTAADLAASSLRTALRACLRADTGTTPLEGPIEFLWSETEQPFRDALRQFAGLPGVDAMDNEIKNVSESWRGTLERAALAAFDRAVPPQGLINKRPSEQAAIIDARKQLVRTLRGHGKSGKAFFKLLSLTPPDSDTKKATSKRSAA